jgi:hypothetical protein
MSNKRRAFHSFIPFAASAAFEEIGVTNNSDAHSPILCKSDLRERIQQQRGGDILSLGEIKGLFGASIIDYFNPCAC